MLAVCGETIFCPSVDFETYTKITGLNRNAVYRVDYMYYGVHCPEEWPRSTKWIGQIDKLHFVLEAFCLNF